ncbi:MAG: aspartate aminotransferase family protein [Halieaceae bacterium]|nr:aspartate aminotransferase family protein [Halieaceae bacterium]
MAIERSSFDSVMVPTYSPAPVIMRRGQGSRVWDQNDREYIDFAGGIAVNCLGHCHPALVQTLTDQACALWHLSNVMTNEPAIRLAQRLVDLTFAERVYFANSGAEANEAALKLARRWALDHHGEHKNEIISFLGSFHGRTFFTVTAGGQANYSDGFGPKPGAIVHANFNDLSSVEALISGKTCAVLVEPIQGEGGVIPADPDFVAGLRALCDQHEALLIFDEVQTGVGRTGSLYAYMQYKVIPDILTTAKSLGGGFPIAAMLTKQSIAESFTVGTHGSTYGGNPLACAIADRVLTIVSDPHILEGVRRRHDSFRSELAQLTGPTRVFKTIRGKGMLIGAELNDAYRDRARELMGLALDAGLMCLVAGTNVIRFTPSLIVSETDIEQGFERLNEAVNQFISNADSCS